MNDKGKTIALLIDAENVSPKYIKVILDELTSYGTPAYKRIYGDWTSADMAGWKKQLLENNLTPIQQFSYTQGKNASDSAMIIDAMDILYGGNCEGFCLVSSDSDFTRLASRLRESAMFVIGMGESKTPISFKSACDAFKYLDVLMNAKSKTTGRAAKNGKEARDAKTTKAKTTRKAPTRAAAKKPRETEEVKEPKAAEPKAAEAPGVDVHEEASAAFVPLDEIVRKIHDIVEHDSEEDGFISLSQVGGILGRLYADFDTRNYGFSKLHRLVDYTGEFETRYDDIPGGGKNLMVKNKG